MADGTRTTDLPQKTVADEFICNVNSATGGATVRVPATAVRAQLAIGTGVAFATWAALAAKTGSSAGERAEVYGDTGTHTDPVVGGTVNNEGIYSWSVSPAGWRWLSPVYSTAIETIAGERTDAKFVLRDPTGNIALLIDDAGMLLPGGVRIIATDDGAAIADNSGTLNLLEFLRVGELRSGAWRLAPNDTGYVRFKDDNGFIATLISADASQVLGGGNNTAASVEPAVLRAWSGAPTATSFSLSCDIEGDGFALVEISTDAAFANVVQQRVMVPVQTGDYRVVKTSFSGLTANTQYYWRITPNGRSAKAATGKVKTFPAVGTSNLAYSFIVGCCADVNAVRAAPVFDAIRLHETTALFVSHIGDAPYAEVTINDIAETRKQLRKFRDCASVTRLHSVMPTAALTRNDHDYVANDTSVGTVLPSGVTHSEICINTRQCDRESAPLYPCYPEANGETNTSKQTQAQVFDVGPDRHIVPDTYTQSIYLTGTPSCLGNGTNPPGSWDQLSWLKAELLRAKTDGCRHIFLYTGRAWNYSANETWSQRYLAEATDICNYLVSNAINNVIIIEGDLHRSLADDGTNTDFSTAGTLTIRRFMCSPYLMVFGANDIPAQWGDDTSAIAPISLTGDRTYEISAYSQINVYSNGNVEMVVKGAPYDPVTFAPTVLATFSTSDL